MACRACADDAPDTSRLVAGVIRDEVGNSRRTRSRHPRESGDPGFRRDTPCDQRGTARLSG